MGQQRHTVLIVRIGNDDELNDLRREWRVKHAVPTLDIVKAWFDYGPVGNDPRVPMRFPDGTYRIHAPSSSTLASLKSYLLPHEGFEIIDEIQEDGIGLHPFDELDAMLRPGQG